MPPPPEADPPAPGAGDGASVVKAIAGRYRSPWFRHYAASKLRTDPLYEAVVGALGESAHPVLDIGCGIGLLGQFLRASGFREPVVGVDFDAGKIEGARQAAEGIGGLSFHVGDAREAVPAFRGSVTLLDLLQFFDVPARAEFLREAAVRVAPGGRLVIRSGVRDRTWRFRVTRLADWFSRCVLWMKSAPAGYPTIGEIRAALESEGLEGEVRPLWGGTPFNNYLFVFRRPDEAGEAPAG